jgi:hypothetical protein
MIAVCSENYSNLFQVDVLLNSTLFRTKHKLLHVKIQSVPRSKHTPYKYELVNVVWGNNSCLFSDPHKTHKYSCVGRTYNYI